MLRKSDYGGLRSDAVAAACERVRLLAREGLPVIEIEARLGPSLTRTEREVLRPVIRSEVHGARCAVRGSRLMR